MFRFLRRERGLKITAQISDEWTFRIDGRETTSLTIFNDWLNLLQHTFIGGGDAPVARNPVGFSRNHDLGDASAETSRAEDDGDD